MYGKQMIICNDWGLHLRWGNYGIMYLALQAISDETGHELHLPEYFAWKYLENPPKIATTKTFDINFSFANHSEQNFMDVIKFFKDNADKTINICIGIATKFQNANWWKGKKCTDIISFKSDCLTNVRDKYASFFNGKKNIGIGIRRGDFVNHCTFYQIPITWYEHALQKIFPDWRECNVIIFSDNINECKKLLNNPYFLYADHNESYSHRNNFEDYHKDPMEHFLLATMCDHFIAGQSTFHWLAMQMIALKENSIIVHSGKNLSEESDKIYKLNDCYYPDCWVNVPIEV